MDKVNDGGPAFPIPLAPGELYTETGSGCGMTLRDWFAGQALPRVIEQHTLARRTRGVLPDYNDGAHRAAVADIAYRISDAMIAERTKQKS